MSVAALPTWNVAPVALLRMAGLPFSAVAGLRFTRTVALFDEHERLARRTAADRSLVCDEVLFGAVGNCDRASKPQLVALKRRIYNGSVPSAKELRAVAAIPGQGARRLVLRQVWRLRKMQRLKAEARSEFEREYAGKLAHLEKVARDPAFLRGLAVTSPDLSRAVAKAGGKAGNRRRFSSDRILQALLRYVARACAKTSPFSHFGPFAFAEVDGESPHSLAWESGRGRESRILVNALFEDQLISLVSAIPAVADFLPWFVNPTVSAGGDGAVMFMQPGIAGGRPGYLKLQKCVLDDESMGILDALRHTDQVFDPVATLRADGLFQGVGDRDVSALLDRLCRAGLLERRLRIPGDADDRLGQLRAFVSSLPGAGLECLRTSIRNIIDRLGSMTGAGFEARIAASSHIRNCVERIGDTYGIDVSAITRACIYEDVDASAMQPRVGGGMLDAIGSDLALYLNCLVARDRGGSYPYRKFRNLFRERFGQGGTCDNLLLASGLYADLHRRARTTPLRSLEADPEHARCTAGKRQFARRFDAIRAEGEGAEEIRITRELLLELRQALGGNDLPATALAAHVQLQEHPGSPPSAFLNACIPGYARYVDRYSGAARAAPERGGTGMRERMLDWCAMQLEHVNGGGARPAHVFAFCGHSGQRFPRLFDAQIVPPDELSCRAEGGLRFSDLALSHDAVSDSLFLHLRGDVGQRIAPVLLGTLHQESLSPLQLLLGCLAANTACPDSVEPGTLRHDARGGEPLHFPRLRLGRLVVERQSWLLGQDALPAEVTSGDDEFEAFFEMHRWARGHGIPNRLFFRPKLEGQRILGRHKPLYLDLEVPFLVNLFAQELRGNPAWDVHLEEMLPEGESHWRPEGDEARVAELHIEIGFNAPG